MSAGLEPEMGDERALADDDYDGPSDAEDGDDAGDGARPQD